MITNKTELDCLLKVGIYPKRSSVVKTNGYTFVTQGHIGNIFCIELNNTAGKRLRYIIDGHNE